MQSGEVRRDLPWLLKQLLFPSISTSCTGLTWAQTVHVSCYVSPSWRLNHPSFLFDIALSLIHPALHPFLSQDCDFLLLFLYVWQVYTKKEVPSPLLEQPMPKSFLSIPEMTPLMCKAFKNQCIPRVCSVTAVFVLFSQASWQQAAKWMIRPHCIAFVKYFSTAGKYHHTWVRHVQDALSVHCQGSGSRFGYQNNGQHRLPLH